MGLKERCVLSQCTERFLSFNLSLKFQPISQTFAYENKSPWAWGLSGPPLWDKHWNLKCLCDAFWRLLIFLKQTPPFLQTPYCLVVNNVWLSRICMLELHVLFHTFALWSAYLFILLRSSECLIYNFLHSPNRTVPCAFRPFSGSNAIHKGLGEAIGDPRSNESYYWAIQVYGIAWMHLVNSQHKSASTT